MRSFRIADRAVGDGASCLVIAEAGVNHNGDVGLAKQLIDVAQSAGADAVKFQTFRAERLTARTAQKAEYQKKTTGGDESQFEMLKKLELSEPAFRELFDYCASKGIVFLSTPFDEESADFLETLGVAAYKISSGELTNIPFIEHVARKNKPIILSTGMSWLNEVEAAVRAIEATANRQLALLHCTSNYPTPASDVNLRAMQTLDDSFGYPVGYSDHTAGIEISIAAVARGAAVIEKHFTLDRTLPGPDHQASVEPSELRSLIDAIRNVEAALGDGAKAPTSGELDTSRAARKSLVAAFDLQAGALIERTMVTAKRPGTGLQPSMLDSLIGKRLRRALAADEQFLLTDVDH